MLAGVTTLLARGVIPVIVAGLLVGMTNIGSPLERLSYDLLYAFAAPRQADDFLIIYLDEKSHQELDQPLDKIWNRRLHAELLNKLTAEGARLVIYDILFDMQSSDPDADNAFAEAIKSNSRVVLGASLKAQRNLNVIERVVSTPMDLFRESAADWGLFLLDPVDSDFGVRHIRTSIEHFTIDSATWVAATILKPDLISEKDIHEEETWINYLGPPGTIASISFSQALIPQGAPEAYFKDKIVFVGGKYAAGYSGEMRDNFRTPYSLRGHPFAPGVELHANILANLLDRNWLTRMPVAIEIILILIVGLLMPAIFGAVNQKFAFAGALALVILLSIASIQFITVTLVYFNWLVPVVIQIPLALVMALGYRYYLIANEQRRLRNAFASYLSPVMADRIADSGFDPSPGGEMKDCTVMFTDLQNFTSLSESSHPEEIVDILNTYFEVATKDILDRDGTILKYIGDSVMAIWGAPVDDAQQADNAVHAAVAVIHSTAEQKIYGHDLRTRIGVNSGPCLVGNLGSSFRFDYTAIGDCVNLAARIESFNKQLGTEILITQSTVDLITSQAYLMRPVGLFQLVGKDIGIPLTEVLVDTDPEEKWILTFARGLAAFTTREFAAAKNLFDETISIRGEDGPSAFYLDTIESFLENPPGEDWQGEIRVTSK